MKSLRFIFAFLALAISAPAQSIFTPAPASGFDLTANYTVTGTWVFTTPLAASNLAGVALLAGSYADPAWITSLSGTKLTGTVTATNGVVTTGSYSNPSWITGLAWSKITSTPTTIAGYGITDPIVLTSGTYSDPAWITSLSAAKLSGSIADARLSANVPLLNANNAATGRLSIAANGVSGSAAFSLTGTPGSTGTIKPLGLFEDSSASANTWTSSVVGIHAKIVGAKALSVFLDNQESFYLDGLGDCYLPLGVFHGAFSGNGSLLTTLGADQITSGTIADARLSVNVPLLNAGSNTFTGAGTFSSLTSTQNTSALWKTTTASASNVASEIRIQRAEGTTSLPTGSASGDTLGQITFYPYQDATAGYTKSAQITVSMDGAASGQNVPTRMDFGLHNSSTGTTPLSLRADSSATFSGAVTAASFSGSGASLTALNGSNVASGIVPSLQGGTGVSNAGTLTNATNTTITGGGTIALGGKTLTIANTGTAALLSQANAFTANMTTDHAFTSSQNGASGVIPMWLQGTVYAPGSGTSYRPLMMFSTVAEDNAHASTPWPGGGTYLGFGYDNSYNGNIISARQAGSTVFQIDNSGNVYAVSFQGPVFGDGSGIVFSNQVSLPYGFYGLASSSTGPNPGFGTPAVMANFNASLYGTLQVSDGAQWCPAFGFSSGVSGTGNAGSLGAAITTVPNILAVIGTSGNGSGAGFGGNSGNIAGSLFLFQTGAGGAASSTGAGGNGGDIGVSTTKSFTIQGGVGGASATGQSGGLGGTVKQVASVIGGTGGAAGSGAAGGAGGIVGNSNPAAIQIQGGTGGIGGSSSTGTGGAGGASNAAILSAIGGTGGAGGTTGKGGAGGATGQIVLNGGNGGAATTTTQGLIGGAAGNLNLSGGNANGIVNSGGTGGTWKSQGSTGGRGGNITLTGTTGLDGPDLTAQNVSTPEGTGITSSPGTLVMCYGATPALFFKATGVQTDTGHIQVMDVNGVNTAKGVFSSSVTIGGGAPILKVLTATATLDFPSTAAQLSADLTITVTGAALGDCVILGVPNGSTLANSDFSAWVSATNTATVRFNNYKAGAQDPASGTFRVSVIQF